MEILRSKDLCRLFQVNRSTLHNWRQDADFPKPVRLGPRLVGWLGKDIEEWLERRKGKAAA